MKSKIIALLATAGLLLSQIAAASTVNIFSTGVDAAGNVVPHGTVGDLHYQLVSAPAGTASTIIAATSTGGYPIAAGIWLGDTTTSTWLGPNSSTLDGPVGLYIYRTQFTLTAAQLAGASLTGMWSADNGAGNGAGIFLNATNVGAAATSFNVWDSYSISSGFVLGLNQLDFAVYNFGGPTGVRVAADQAPADVPEPASLAILGLGLLGVAASRRKAKRA